MTSSTSSTETAYDYGSKYTQQNPLTRFLIDRFFSSIEDVVRLAKPSSALEVGSGEGFSTRRIKTMLGAGARFESCDVEQRLVAAASAANPDVPIIQDSIYDLHRKDGEFDLVLACEVLEHLDDPAKALRELTRVTRRWLVLSVPWEPIWRVINVARGRYWSDLGNTPGHIQHWSRDGFVRLVGSVADVRQVRAPFPWTVVLAEKR
jgi:SAM-dependent methyltransferase